jgi:aminopeptidase N
VKQPDLLLLNDDDLTFTKFRLDERSWKTAVAHLGDIDSSLARALIWGAAWDMTRDAEVSTGDFLDLVISGIEKESDVGVVQGVLRQLKAAIDQFAAASNRPAYVGRIAAALLEFARRAEPGSDHQLAFTRSFITSATTAEELAILQGLLDGSVIWPGLAVDTDLRWTLIQRLVTVGVFGDAEIDAELVRDDTATGRRQAAFARAARPTAEAKAQAWTDIVERSDLPNAIQESTIGGFVHPDHVELLLPYRDKYFAALGELWKTRTNETATNITVGLYPFLLVDDTTLALTDAALAGDLGATPKRLLSEGRDGVERAARARARDARG